MAGGGARRGTLVIHYGTGHRRPAPRPRQPRDEPRSCGSQPAHQSVIDRRLSRRPLPCASVGRCFASEPSGRRTPMPPAIESGHESGTIGTNADGFRRIEVITGVGRHRRWTREEKAWIVAESLDPTTAVSAVARRHGLHASRLFPWRQRLAAPVAREVTEF